MAANRRFDVLRDLTRGRQQEQQSMPASENEQVSLGSPEQWAGAVGRGPAGIADATYQVRNGSYGTWRGSTVQGNPRLVLNLDKFCSAT